MITPSKKDFLQLIKDVYIPPLYEEISYSPPSLIYESLASTNSFLLESVKGPEKIARYSFIGFDPCLIFKTRNGLIEIESSEKKTISSNKPLSVLKNLVKRYRQKPFENLPPFQGGIAGILSYDFVQYFELLPNNSVDDLNLPDAHFLMIDKLIAIDHLYKMCWIIYCPGVKDSIKGNGINDLIDWAEKYDEAEEKIDDKR